MPARKRHHGFNTQGDWTRMLRADVREREVARIKRDHPDTFLALNHLASVMKEYDDHGWTVFNDWLEVALKKALSRKWPDGVPLLSADGICRAVFPACRA